MEEWFKLGLIKTFLVIIIILINKYESKTINYCFPITVNLIASIFLLVYSFNYLTINDFKKLNYIYVIIVALCITITHFISYKIIKTTPNPAYIRIFSAMDMILVLLISYLFFKEKITCPMIVGFTLITLGIIILSYY